MKKELLKLTGMTDMGEFDRLVAEVAPEAMKEVNSKKKTPTPLFAVHLN